MTAKIEIVPYNPQWPGIFKEIASHLRLALGNLAVRIDHIGSTSIPGMAAKDIIDIQVTVAALEPALQACFLALGYTQAEGIRRDHPVPGFNGPESDWEKWYFRPPAGQHPTHTHVRVPGRPNQRYPLLFRDYLRLHPATAEAYAELKRRLAANLADPDTYPDVKDPAVDLIYLPAEDWAKAVLWTPGASDA